MSTRGYCTVNVEVRVLQDLDRALVVQKSHLPHWRLGFSFRPIQRERDLSWVMPNKDMNFYSNIWGSLIKSDGEEYADTYSNCTNKPGNA